MADTQSAEEGLVGGNTNQAQHESENTFDWTDVIKLHKDSLEKPYSIDKLATSEVTHVIPYLEVYRTDEVLFRPYISPYLTTSNNVEETDEESSSSSDEGSSDSSDIDLNPPQSILKKNEKLSNELKKIVKKYFRKEVNVTTMVARYMDCDANKESISTVTKHSSVWLKLETTPSTLNNEVLDAKKKYG